MNTKTTTRTYYFSIFDLLKGYALLTIIALHVSLNFVTSVPEQLSNHPILIELWNIFLQFPLLWNCCMIIFFMISGFGFKKAPLWETLKKQAQSLLVPYMVTGFISLALMPIFFRLVFPNNSDYIWHLKSNLFSFLFGSTGGITVFGQETTGIGPIWFLFALFIAWNLVNIYFHMANERIAGILAILTSFAGYLIATHIHLPYFICQGLMGTGFLYLGYFLRNHQTLLKNHSPLFWVPILGSSLISICLGQFGIAGYVFRLGFFELIGAGCTAFILMYIAVLVDEKIDNPICDTLRDFGANSLIFMCIHSIDTFCVPWPTIIGHFLQYSFIGILGFSLIKFAIVFILFTAYQKLNKKYRKWKRKQKKQNQAPSR